MDIPRTSLDEIRFNRVLDWNEQGKFILRKFEEHEERYREKICSRCDDEQKRKRRCSVSEGADSNGNPITYCEHMNSATHQKYRKMIHSFINSHPMFNRA